MHYHAIAVPIRAVLLVTLTKRECSPALPRVRARGYLTDCLALRLIVVDGIRLVPGGLEHPRPSGERGGAGGH